MFPRGAGVVPCSLRPMLASERHQGRRNASDADIDCGPRTPALLPPLVLRRRPAEVLRSHLRKRARPLAAPEKHGQRPFPYAAARCVRVRPYALCDAGAPADLIRCAFHALPSWFRRASCRASCRGRVLLCMPSCVMIMAAPGQVGQVGCGIEKLSPPRAG